MLIIPIDLQIRMQRLGTTNLQINVPSEVKIAPQELLQQLYKFVEDIETGKIK